MGNASLCYSRIEASRIVVSKMSPPDIGFRVRLVLEKAGEYQMKFGLRSRVDFDAYDPMKPGALLIQETGKL